MPDKKYPTMEERWAEEEKNGSIFEVLDDEDPFLESDDGLELGDDEDDDEDAGSSSNDDDTEK